MTDPPRDEPAPLSPKEKELQEELEKLIHRALDSERGDSREDGGLDAAEALAGLDLDEHLFHRQFIDKSNDAMYVVDLFGTFRFLNSTAERLIGYPREELVGRNIARFLYPDGLKKAVSIMAALIRGRKIPPHELVVKTASGDRTGEMTVTLIKRGVFPVGILGIARDVTERKAGEDILRESEGRYRTLVELSADPVAVIQDERFSYVNPAFFDLFGYSESDLDGGLNYLSLVAPEDRDVIRQRYEDRIAGKEVAPTNRVDLIAKDGRVVNCQTSASRIEHNGRPANLVIFHDLSERVKVVELLMIQHELAAGLSASNSLRKGLELCLDAAFNVSGMNAGGIYILDQDRKCFELTHSSNLTEKFIRDNSCFPLDTPQGQIAIDGRPIFTTAWDRDDVVRTELQKEGLQALAVLPILHEERVVGCMNVSSKDVREIPPFARQALSAISDQIGSAVARLTAEKGLRESEERYRRLVDTIPHGIAEIDTSGVITFANEAHGRIFGLKGGEIVGSTIYEFSYSPIERDTLRDFIHHVVVDQPAPRPWTGRMAKRDGSPVFIQVDWDYKRDESGAVAGFSAIISDITYRREAEEALRESEVKFRVLAEESPNMIFINKRGRVVYVNEQCVKTMGYTREEYYLEDFDLHTIFAPEDIGRLEDATRRHVAGEEVLPREYTLVTKEGRRLEALVATKVVTYDGEQAILGITTDITERKRSEEALRESEERYRSLVDQSREVIFTLTPDGCFNFLNPAFTIITGWCADEWLGRKFEDIVHPDERMGLRRRFGSLLRGEALPQNEVRVRMKGGGYVAVEYTTVPIRKQGAVVEIWGIARDITSRIKAEEDRRKLTVLKEREGISRWLHDHLGADLYNIILLVDGVQKRAPDQAVATQQLEWVSETSRNALASIRNYLDFSTQMGTSFGSIVEHMEKYGRSLLTPMGMEFALARKGEIDECSLSGLQMFSIYLIFKESLTNIVKHARAGRIDVTVSAAEKRLNITIEDDGEGFTSDGVLSGHYGTTNLRTRAEELGADLRINTEPQKGTKVEFSMPLE